MRFRHFAAAAALGVAALALSACAESINTTVSRYQAMPAPQGQTFFVVPDSPMAANGGLEFQRYASIVAQQLQAHGYAPAADPKSATMLVQFGYGMDKGTVRYQDYGGYPYYSGFYGPWGSPFHHSRFGWGGGYYWGWNDPYWYGGGLDSYISNLEREAIMKALQETRYNKTAAAKKLGITFRAMRYKLKKLGID